MSFNHLQNASDTLALERGCRFDSRKGEAVCRFVETFCRQSKGEWGGKPVVLMDWQRDFIMRLYGWRQADGRRRFRTVYLEVAKKNGKTTLLSALSIYHAIADGEKAPEVYLNAVNRKQADNIFEEAARMVEASPDLSSRFEITRSTGRISDPVGYGRIAKNSADAPSADGVNASAVFFDELHRFQSRRLWDVMEYAGSGRRQPLRIVITTAGEEAQGPWYEQREYSERVNVGAIQDTAHLGIIFRAVAEDDLDDPATWRKANPSLGITIDEEQFAREWEQAKLSPTSRANFLRLRLDIIAAGPQQFLEADRWDRCQSPPSCDPDDGAYIGLDLSSIDDLTVVVEARGDTRDGVDLVAHFFLPRDNIAELEGRHQQPYREWARLGFITLTPGNTIDRAFIRKWINKRAERSHIRKILTDPYNASQLAIELKEQDGLPVEFVRQGFLSLSDPTKELLRLILAGKIRHNANPILRWHALNAVVVRDAADNMKLHKEKSRKKIDGLAAAVNAIAGMITETADTEPSVYETRGPIFMSY